MDTCRFNIIFSTFNIEFPIISGNRDDTKSNEQKDKNVQGISYMFYVQREKTVFYHKNPYFNVESVSDDQEFLMRTSLPF